MKGFCLDVTGDYACFTRPEMKVERVSYDVITPSAARGIFEAIFWKPAIRWHIKKIELINPIQWMTVRRNEVKSVASMRGKGGILIENDRQQRAALLLRDVHYRLYAEFDFIPPERRAVSMNPTPEWLLDHDEKASFANSENHPDETEAKYAAIFERRARKGQYFMHPYLGTREFSCREVRLIKNGLENEPKPVPLSCDFGFMLYDMDYSNPNDIRPMFFRAVMTDGIIEVPSPNSEEVYK